MENERLLNSFRNDLLLDKSLVIKDLSNKYYDNLTSNINFFTSERLKLREEFIKHTFMPASRSAIRVAGSTGTWLWEDEIKELHSMYFCALNDDKDFLKNEFKNQYGVDVNDCSEVQSKYLSVNYSDKKFLPNKFME